MGGIRKKHKPELKIRQNSARNLLAISIREVVVKNNWLKKYRSWANRTT
jgi:hypothetical protein